MFWRLLIVSGVCGVWVSSAAAQTGLPRRNPLLHDRRADSREMVNVPDAEPTDTIPVAWSAKLDNEVRAELAIRRALEQRINLVSNNLPLKTVIAQFAAKSGVPCVINERSLVANSLDSEMPVAFRSTPWENAGSALDRLLGPLDLAWVYSGSGIMITTKQDADTVSYVRVYPVADLVLPGNGARRWDGVVSPPGSTIADFDPLIEIIFSTVQPMTWEPAGGPGNLKGFEASLALVCDQTRQVHDEIEVLLGVLRNSRAAQRVADKEEVRLQEIASRPTDDDKLNAYRPTVRMRGGQNNVAAWQVPRTKDGRAFRVQTTPGKPDIQQGFGGGLGGFSGGAF